MPLYGQYVHTMLSRSLCSLDCVTGGIVAEEGVGAPCAPCSAVKRFPDALAGGMHNRRLSRVHTYV